MEKQETLEEQKRHCPFKVVWFPEECGDCEQKEDCEFLIAFYRAIGQEHDRLEAKKQRKEQRRAEWRAYHDAIATVSKRKKKNKRRGR